jgi:RNA polymerase sigma-70 factor (ECF subfamily)
VPKEKESFQALIDDYSRQVLNTAIRILGNREKALDVHQEVFLAIWRRWHKYDGRTNWNAYLYRATVRKALAFAKRPQTRALAEHQRSYPADKEKPDEPLRTAELQQRIAGCLARLSKRQAEVFVMSRIEGLKTEKIAEILGCSQETVRVHLHRAVKRLAAELSDYLK